MATTRSSRTNQLGTMRERPPGHWQLRAFAGNDSITGKPTQRSKTFKGTEKQAAKELAAFVTEAA